MLQQHPQDPKMQPYLKAAYLHQPTAPSIWLWLGLVVMAAGGGYASRQIKEQGFAQFREETSRRLNMVWDQATYRFLAAKSPFSEEKRYIDLVAASRTPVVQTAENHYAFLGLGQDPVTTKQIVWIRNLKTNQIERFAVGDKVFKDHLRIHAIKRHAVEVAYSSKIQKILLLP